MWYTLSLADGQYFLSTYLKKEKSLKQPSNTLTARYAKYNAKEAIKLHQCGHCLQFLSHNLKDFKEHHVIHKHTHKKHFTDYSNCVSDPS